jgi:hypothetical protein
MAEGVGIGCGARSDFGNTASILAAREKITRCEFAEQI